MTTYDIQVGADNVPFVQIESYRLRLDLEELMDADLLERCQKELRETPENRTEGLEALRQLIKDEVGIHLPVDDDQFLLKFLRPCKYYPDSAFKLIRKFYKFKVKHPHVGLNLTPNMVRQVFDDEVFEFLPTRTAEGGRMMVVNVGDKWNPKIVTLMDMFRAVMVAIEIAMMEPLTQLGGVHVILNMQGLSLSHVCQFSPSTAKLIVDWVQECTPVRLKGIHIINQSYFFNMVYAIFKPFLGEKLRKRIIFHGVNKESLCEAIGAASLPTYLGGKADFPHFKGRILSEMLFFYEDKFKLYNTYGYTIEKIST